MIRQLFHGSPSIIEKPQFGYGKVYNDYGLGFYCTDSLEMAKEWGVAQNRNGYANRYELDCDSISFTGSLCFWKTVSLMCPPGWRWRPKNIS